MRFVAKSRYVRFSALKLRPIADVVRGQGVARALSWLATHAVGRAIPVKKTIESAAANAKNMHAVADEDLRIVEIRIDEGPTTRYYKPGAMGRSSILRKRSSHISVTLEHMNQERKEV